MSRRIISALLGATLMTSAAGADAQTIVMRKVIANAAHGSGPGGYQPPAPTGTPAPTPTPTPPVQGTWTLSDARSVTPSCSATAAATRDVWCASGTGQRLPDANCASQGAKPSIEGTVADYSGCSYAWQPVGVASWSSTCSDQATSTRSYVCQRQDGVASVASNCDTSHKETETEVAANLTECDYEVSAWRSTSYSSTCSDKAIRTFEATNCLRTGGGEAPTQVPVSQCAAAGVALTKTDTVAEYSGCSYAWQPIGVATWSSTCSDQATATRRYVCQRQDGVASAASNCDTSHKETETEVAANLSACNYEVTAWRVASVASTCSSNALRTYEATACTRSGGGEIPKVVGLDQCQQAGLSLTKTDRVAVYDGCTYQATYDTTAACVNGYQTAPIKTCTRSDNTPAALSQCAQQSQVTQCTNYVCTAASTRAVTNNVFTGFKSSDYAGKNGVQMKLWAETQPVGRKVIIYSISDGSSGSIPAGTVVNAGYGDVLPQFGTASAYATWYSCVPK